jgi:hypothetical protein
MKITLLPRLTAADGHLHVTVVERPQAILAHQARRRRTLRRRRRRASVRARVTGGGRGAGGERDKAGRRVDGDRADAQRPAGGHEVGAIASGRWRGRGERPRRRRY